MLALPTPAQASWRSLTGPLPAHTSIGYGWQISPNSRYVVFEADLAVEGVNELYSVPIDGSTPVKLNAPLVAGGAVDRFAITPDSQYVLYTADQDVDNRVELYRVPIDGGPVVKLSGTITPGGNVEAFKIDPDNVRVVYLADQTTNDLHELYSAPIAGGSWVKLNGPLVRGGGVLDAFAIEPISNRVVYQAYQDVSTRIEIFGVPIAGGTPVRLNESGAIVDFTFQVNPSLPVVVFSATPSGSSVTRLYMNATAGSLLTELSFTLASNQSVFGYLISPQGDRVVYNVVTDPGGGFVRDGNLYSVLIGGGPSTLLTTKADAGYGVYGATFSISSDNQRVVYRYRRNATAPTLLEAVDLVGGNRVTLYTDAGAPPLLGFHLSADGQSVVYQQTSSAGTLRTVPTSGGSATIVGSGTFHQILPDSSRVLYTTSTISGRFDLFSQLLSGGGQRNLSRVEEQVQVGEVLASPDSQWIVYEVAGTGATPFKELRVSDGAEAPVPQRLFLTSLQR
ncbi:MAG: hypothetical protein JNL73_17085 [Anaerolineales bacterium]|nr:hypothetical protein [Anaerolineales bacterium]